MSFEPREYLRHILAESDYLMEQSRGLHRDIFAADETRRRAFVRSLEIIGEAAKKVPDEWRARYPDVEWQAMSRMRGGLIPSGRRSRASSRRRGRRGGAGLEFGHSIGDGGDPTVMMRQQG